MSAREGVLLGATTLHKPSRLDVGVSDQPGFGEIQSSLCGRFQGIAYDRAWITSHWPELSMCAWCSRALDRSLVDALPGSPGVVPRGERT